MYNNNRGNRGGGSGYGRDNNRGGGGGRGGYGNRGGGGGFRRGPQHDNGPRRNPLPEGFALFYIAIICPEDINNQLRDYKEHMFQRYGCKAAGKSPAHITIVPPFRAEEDLMPNLLDYVTTFNIGIAPFNIDLTGYGNFGDRVLFVDVAPNQSLLQLEQECMQEFAEKFPSIIFGMKPPFNPHVTIATRDIPEGKLQEAKDFFEANHPFAQQFEAKELRLVKLDHGNWNVV
ncbi:2'-5' RNA ligase family protein [Phnomibacter sp. MR]|uniref:2'-5' RNA ligase family protein n=1 Tax=Phnomibacter sp. MR TaxID=3042318 RepID=UPI003A80519C